MKKILFLFLFFCLLTFESISQTTISLYNNPGYAWNKIIVREVKCRNYTDYIQNDGEYNTDYIYHFLCPIQLSSLEDVSRIVVTITNNITYNVSNEMSLSFNVLLTREQDKTYYECNGVTREVKNHKLIIDAIYRSVNKGLFYNNNDNYAYRSFDFSFEVFDSSNNQLGSKTYSNSSSYVVGMNEVL